MTEKKHLVLVRHGTTDWNVPGRLNSSTDIRLNSQGIGEASRLAEYLRLAFPIASIWSSPAIRAQETATAIAIARADTFQTISDAREVDFGQFEGKIPRELINTSEGVKHRAWESGDPVEGIESLADAGVRAKKVFNHIIQSDLSHQHILVTHGVFIRVFICVNALNINPTVYRSLIVDNASISVLQVSDQGVRVSQLNNRCYI